jgi:hypothetical protein
MSVEIGLLVTFGRKGESSLNSLVLLSCLQYNVLDTLSNTGSGEISSDQEEESDNGDEMNSSMSSKASK